MIFVSSNKEIFARAFFMSSTMLYSTAGRLIEVSGGGTEFMVFDGKVLSLLLMETIFIEAFFPNFLWAFCIESTGGPIFLNKFSMNFYFGTSIIVVAL